MSSGLKLTFPEGWAVSQANGDARPAFERTASESPGLFQIHSQAYYRRGPIPNPTAQDLIDLASASALAEGVIVSEVSSGPCELGTFGTVVGTCPGYTRAQIWAVSNGRDIVVLS